MLRAESRANGGHYVVGPCFLRQGHDTSAEADARAESSVLVRFTRDAEGVPYDIKFRTSWIGEHSSSSRFSARLTGPDGVVVAEGESWSFRATPTGNSTYALTVSLGSASKDQGACCSNTAVAAVRTDVEVIRSPGLAQGFDALRAAPSNQEQEVRPFIFGGELVEEGYEAVGALMLGEELDCTGTLVGRQTVLTAGHCLYDRREHLGRLSFRLGNNAFLPTVTRSISGVLFPTALNAAPGMAYVHSNRLPINDIALAYLSAPVEGVAPFVIHTGRPPLEAIRRARTRLDFVGFGFNLVERSKAGIGRKRHVLLPISKIEDRWIRYGDTQGGTCNGDSGGPAFLLDEATGRPAQLLLTGVTSAGPAGCRGSAYDTRVDLFSAWLNSGGRIH